MTLIDKRATKYPCEGGFRVAVYLGVFPSAAAADAAVADLNVLHLKGVLEGREHVLARLRARGAGYAALAEVIAEELKGG
jgi:hypothetical protein